MNIYPKKLTLTEMWTLYNLLKNGLVGGEKEYLIDTVSEMFARLSKHEFTLSMQLMYEDVDMATINPVQAATLFIAGLKKNKFFYFSDFVKGLNGSTQHG